MPAAMRRERDKAARAASNQTPGPQSVAPPEQVVPLPPRFVQNSPYHLLIKKKKKKMIRPTLTPLTRKVL
jgi:hypothetical protein